MNWIFKVLLLSSLILASCDAETNVQKEYETPPCDRILANRFFKRYIAPTIDTSFKEYIILYNESACYSCFTGYFDRLFPKLNRTNFLFFSSKLNNDTIQRQYALEHSIFKTIPKGSPFVGQYFMRHELVILRIDTLQKEVIRFIPIKASNIDTLTLH